MSTINSFTYGEFNQLREPM